MYHALALKSIAMGMGSVISQMELVNVMLVTLVFLAKIVIWDTTRARKINLVLFANLASVVVMQTSVIP